MIFPTYHVDTGLFIRMILNFTAIVKSSSLEEKEHEDFYQTAVELAQSCGVLLWKEIKIYLLGMI